MNDKQINITALLITFNEGKHIEEAIKTVSFADEIIVVDSYSTDKTLKILENFNHVKVIKREFKNFADQRNFAIDQAVGNWILFLDADERIPENLKNEILESIKNPKDVSAFMFKRLFYFNNKRVYFCGLQTDTTYRLFKNGSVKYIEDKLVHEMPKIDGKSAVLKNPMQHYSFDNYEHFKLKMENYAKLKAKELFMKGKKASPFHFVFRPIYKFITNYVIRLGFLDGKKGVNLCYLMAYGVWYRYKTLKGLHLKKSM
ncbi:MAG: glycosyltransferase family 2 protein [Jejuia sp.]